MTTRRDLLLGTGALLGMSGLSGCVHPVRDEGGLADAPQRDGNLEIRLFQGGFGIDFYERAAKEYEAAHPGVKIDLEGDPRIWEQLRPRFVAGEPPSLTLPGWGMDHYALIYEGQCLPVDDALLTSPYGESEGTWRDTFLPEILKMGEYKGQTYLLPLYLTLNGWWYNKNLFAEHGWKPPKTWNELLALCEQIKGKGIAPLTHQGKYPYYALQGFILPWAISIGGIEIYNEAEHLKPGSWKSEPFLKAAQMVEELRTKGYLQEGANGMSHTEAQMEFLRGKAAMIPCGTWLESEMKKQLPPGFRMEFFLPPSVEGGKGDPTSLQVGAEPWIIPTKGKNHALAIDYFKYISSPEKARQFMLEKGTVTAIKGTDTGDVPESLQAPLSALREARVTWTTNYSRWYKSLEEAMRTSMGALLQGSATPQQFVDQVESAADKVRRDPNIPKHG